MIISTARKLALAGFAAAVLCTAAVSAQAQTGHASWYKMGKVTANGERFDPHGLTAAHRTLPFGTEVKVQNLRNGKSVVVRINDRGPFIKSRMIDLSMGAAQKIGLIQTGTARVQIQVLN